MIGAALLPAPCADLSAADRIKVLQAGARRLCHVVRPVRDSGRLRVGGSGVDLVAWWSWLGVLAVADRYAQPHQTLVQSPAGQPEVLDAGGAWEERGWTRAEASKALQLFAATLPRQEVLPYVYLQLQECMRRGGVPTRATAHWHWPGVQVVLDRDLDLLLAISRPGQPTEPAELPAVR